MPPSRALLHTRRLLPDDPDYFLVTNADSTAFAANDVLVCVDLDGSGVFSAKLAKATTALLKDGLLLIAAGPVAVGATGPAVLQAVIPFNTAAAASANVPVYLDASTGGSQTLTAPSAVVQTSVVLGTPATVANGGAILCSPSRFSPVAATTALLSNLASTASGKGASLIGVQDAAASVVGATVEAVLAELATPISMTPGAEASNAIPVVIAGPAHVAQYVARIYDADMLLETAANYTLAETGAGAEVSTTAKASLLFTTDAAGAATITVTDVSTSSTDTLYLEVSPMAVPGGAKPGPGAIVAITFA